jgi:hypothetical protein
MSRFIVERTFAGALTLPANDAGASAQTDPDVLAINIADQIRFLQEL